MKKKLFKRLFSTALAFVVLITQTKLFNIVSLADNASETVETDVAVSATPSSDYTADWENLNGINNANFEPASSNVGTGQGWGNWLPQTEGSTHWLQYDWENEITTSKLEIYWYDDGGNTRVPSEISIQYKDSSGNWQNAVIKTDINSAKELNMYNTIEIEEITTSAIRLNMTVATGAQAVGVYRFKVISEVASAEVFEALLDKLTINERATMDFQLPNSVDGNDITWTENHSAINIADGWAEITRGTTDVTGTVTATIGEGDNAVSKDFQVVVAKKAEDNNTTAVNFTNVTITDEFWAARQKAIICQTILVGIEHVEAENGGFDNFVAAAKVNNGELDTAVFEGSVYFLDSDLYKMIEAMSYALQINADGDEEVISAQEEIRETLEKWIPYVEGAQESDGYLDTFFTLDHKSNSNFTNNTDEKWTDFSLHELYCAGHFYEGAVAYTRATNYEDTRLLDVAVKNADLTVETFGLNEDQLKACPGHEEIELALIKLAAVCEEMGDREYADGVTYASKAESYVRLAQFFLSVRGDNTDRDG